MSPYVESAIARSICTSASLQSTDPVKCRASSVIVPYDSFRAMTSTGLKCENAAQAEVLPDRVQDSNDLDSTIHHPKGWWSWRLVASSEFERH
jgi:hypothetical protein